MNILYSFCSFFAIFVVIQHKLKAKYIHSLQKCQKNYQKLIEIQQFQIIKKSFAYKTSPHQKVSQLAIACSKLTIETLKQGVKYV